MNTFDEKGVGVLTSDYVIKSAPFLTNFHNIFSTFSQNVSNFRSNLLNFSSDFREFSSDSIYRVKHLILSFLVHFSTT